MKQQPNENGFTLVEVMVAITVFAVGILAAASMQITSTQTNASARGITESTMAGSMQMERLMGRPWSHPDLVDRSRLDEVELADLPPAQINVGRSQISWTVRDNIPTQDTKTVVMTITTNDRGIVKTITLNKVMALGQ